MVKMQSPRVQCCFCAASVMLALFGMFMLSTGVCLVLNYNFIDVDTSGLPPNLHNEEGKKVVGIILICCGVAALGGSGLISALYFTVCARRSSSTPPSAQEQKSGQGETRPSSNEGQGQVRPGQYHSNGTTTLGAVGGARPKTGAAAMPVNGRRVSAGDPRARGGGLGSTPPGTSRPYRHGKKGRHHHGQGRYKNRLPSHPEEASGEAALSPRRLAFPERSGHINQAAELNDHVLTPDSGAPSSFSVTPPVTIKVDSSFIDHETGARGPAPEEGETGYSQQPKADLASDLRQVPDGDVESGMGGGGGSETEPSKISGDSAHVEEARKQLDTQMAGLLS